MSVALVFRVDVESTEQRGQVTWLMGGLHVTDWSCGGRGFGGNFLFLSGVSTVMAHMALTPRGGRIKDITACWCYLEGSFLLPSGCSQKELVVVEGSFLLCPHLDHQDTLWVVPMQVSKSGEFCDFFFFFLMVVPLIRNLIQLFQVTFKPKAEEASKQQYNYC